MKRKVLVLMLAVSCSMAAVTACGTKEVQEESQEVVEETVEEPKAEEEVEAPAPEEPETEVLSYDLYLKTNEDGSLTGYDKDGNPFLVNGDSLSEEEKGKLKEETGITVLVEVEKGNVPEALDGAAPVLNAKQLQDMEEGKAYELKTAVDEKLLGYTIEEMAATPMFAKQSVNVRSGPSTDYEKVGSLSYAQEVSVTGLASTNWYRISFNDQTAYVSANYLVNEKPVKQVASTGSTGGSTGGGSASGAQPTEADLYTVYSEAEMDAAYAAGDMALYNQMITANTDAFDAKWGTSWGSVSAEALETPAGGSGGGEAAPAEKSTSLSREFIDYLNQKRAEEGLETLAWSDSMAGTAQERAEELVDDFSHNGSRNCSGEILLKTPNEDSAFWYNSFYESGGHRATMLGNYNTVAAAFCKSGSYYYVVVLFNY